MCCGGLFRYLHAEDNFVSALRLTSWPDLVGDGSAHGECLHYPYVASRLGAMPSTHIVVNRDRWVGPTLLELLAFY